VVFCCLLVAMRNGVEMGLNTQAIPKSDAASKNPKTQKTRISKPVQQIVYVSNTTKKM